MKTLLITTLLFIGLYSSAQLDYGSNQLTVSAVDKVTLTPDYYLVELVFSEKVNVNEETQLPESIEMASILKEMTEKLKPYDLELEDLVLDNLWQTSHVNNNVYGVVNYNSTQKRLLGNRYVLKWTDTRERLFEFLKSLRFNGFDSSVIKPQFEAEKIKKERAKLFAKVIAEAKETAAIMAVAAERKLGKVKSIYENNANLYGYQPYQQNNIRNQSDMYVYNSFSISTAQANLTGKVETVSVTLTYELLD